MRLSVVGSSVKAFWVFAPFVAMLIERYQVLLLRRLRAQDPPCGNTPASLQVCLTTRSWWVWPQILDGTPLRPDMARRAFRVVPIVTAKVFWVAFAR